jgi:hypothetical protein
MKRLVILLILLVVVSEDVFAQRTSTITPRRRPSPEAAPSEDNSVLTYDMYVPRPGSNYLNLGLSLLNYESIIRIGNQTTKGSGYGLNLNYVHGLTTWLSYFISQDIYGYKYEVTPITTPSGNSEVSTLGPTLIGFKGMQTFQGSFFYYSAAYHSAILEKRDSNSGINIFTENDRRNNIQVSGGFGALLDKFSLGGLYTHFIYNETEVDNSNVTTKYKAGTGSRWKFYAQLERRYKLGFSYGEEKIGAADTSTANVVTRNGYAELEYQRLQAYAIIPISVTTDFFGDLTKIDRKNVTGYSKYDHYIGTVAVRISF